MAESRDHGPCRAVGDHVSSLQRKDQPMRLLALPVACVVVFGGATRAAAQVPLTSIGEPAIPLRAVPFVTTPVEADVPGEATSVGATAEAVLPMLADPAALLPLDGQPAPVATAPAPTLAFEYSEGYRQRARIHKIASLATIPIFATEAIVGQSLYTNPTSGKRSLHSGVSAALGGLFAVNTVTGVWNLLEARKDPHFGRKKWAHALMMLGADVGFVATAALAPESEHGESSSSRGAHRAVAFSAIALSTTSYLIMLFGD